MMLIDEHPEALLEKFMRYQPPSVDKARWVLQMTNNTVAKSRVRYETSRLKEHTLLTLLILCSMT